MTNNLLETVDQFRAFDKRKMIKLLKSPHTIIYQLISIDTVIVVLEWGFVDPLGALGECLGVQRVPNCLVFTSTETTD